MKERALLVLAGMLLAVIWEAPDLSRWYPLPNPVGFVISQPPRPSSSIVAVTASDILTVSLASSGTGATITTGTWATSGTMILPQAIKEGDCVSFANQAIFLEGPYPVFSVQEIVRPTGAGEDLYRLKLQSGHWTNEYATRDVLVHTSCPRKT